jgi:hypothetical protein
MKKSTFYNILFIIAGIFLLFLMFSTLILGLQTLNDKGIYYILTAIASWTLAGGYIGYLVGKPKKIISHDKYETNDQSLQSLQSLLTDQSRALPLLAAAQTFCRSYG